MRPQPRSFGEQELPSTAHHPLSLPLSCPLPPVPFPRFTSKHLAHPLFWLFCVHRFLCWVWGSLLQGWSLLNVPEADRKRLLASVTSIVFSTRVPSPTPQEMALARELIRSRWRFLMPVRYAMPLPAVLLSSMAAAVSICKSAVAP